MGWLGGSGSHTDRSWTRGDLFMLPTKRSKKRSRRERGRQASGGDSGAPGALLDRPHGGPALWQLILAGAAAAAFLSVLVTRMDVALLVGVGLAALGAVLLFAFPFTGVLLAVFVLYTNLPAHAVERGLIPGEAAGMVGVLFLPALLRHLVARREDVRLDRTFGLMVALLAVMLVSAFFAVDVRLALSYMAGFSLEGMAVFLLVLNTVRDRPALTRVLMVVVGSAAFLAVLSIYQTVTGNYHQEFFGLAQRTTEGLEFRSRGPTDDANRYAQILLVAGCFALGLFWVLKGKGRAAALAAGGLILAAVLLTYSRGAFLTLVPLILFLGAVRVIRPRRIAMIVLVGVLLVPAVVPGYVDRIRTIAGAQGLVSPDAAVSPDGPTRGRTTQMLAALLAYAEHPFLGVGPGQYVPHYSVHYQLQPEIAFRELPTPRRAHNLFLEFAAETGTAGLLFFLAIPGLLLRDLWRIRKRAGFGSGRPHLTLLPVGFMLAILSYIGTGMFLHLAFQRYYWLLIGLTAAAVWIMRDELAEEEWSGSGSMPPADEEFSPRIPYEARR